MITMPIISIDQHIFFKEKKIRFLLLKKYVY